MKRSLAIAALALCTCCVGKTPLPPLPPDPLAPAQPMAERAVDVLIQTARANDDGRDDRTPTPPPVREAAIRPDGSSVDSIVAALYESVSHGPEDEPNWKRMREVFLPVGRFIPPNKPQEDLFTVLDVDAFRERVREGAAAMKARGESSALTEREIARRADCFGNVCQIFSTYEARRAPFDEKPLVRGIRGIQLVRDGKRWWIASVVWDTERPDNPIPADYLKSSVPSEYLKKN